MKVFLLGTHWLNAGPDNVNKKIISVSDDRLVYLKSNNKIRKTIETLSGIIRSDIIIISSLCSPKYYRVLKASRKKIVYLMHGDIRFENEVNHQNTDPLMIELQNKILKDSARIVCVSQGYAKWVKNRYPEFSQKITYVNNGIDLSRRQKKQKQSYSIAVAGGNRPIKANKYVCNAVRILQEQGIECRVYVFGRHYSSCDDLPDINGLEYMGHLDEKEYYEKLDEISIFIMNSDVESFGLTLADAINCNCSLLMSRNIGAASILMAKDSDYINNNHDPKEIAEKIIAVEKKPNIDRLFRTIDITAVSAEASYKKLMQICGEVMNECL